MTYKQCLLFSIGIRKIKFTKSNELMGIDYLIIYLKLVMNYLSYSLLESSMSLEFQFQYPFKAYD